MVSVSRPVAHARTVKLPLSVTNVAVHWRGGASARLRIAFSRDGHRFGRARHVLLDEVGEGARVGETYGGVIRADGARLVRIWSDRPLRRVTVVAFVDRGPPLAWPRPRSTLRFNTAATTTLSGVAQPSVIPRSGWSADESLRFDATGKEIWPPAFYPVQKAIVHHTATQNNDPDPAATIRSIYQYHAVTQGWGDIGYNFLIDEAGRIYEGRYSRPYAAGESPTGEDLNGNGVTAAHTQGYNSGTVGIAPPSPDFSLSAAPASQSIVRGGTSSYAVSISPSGGFTDAVTLNVSGLPGGATASFSPNPTPTMSTLSVRTTTTTKTGTYTLSISGTAGVLTRTTTVTIQVRRK
jgi:N-acetylmuramoyl-L-alanine amidase